MKRRKERWKLLQICLLIWIINITLIQSVKIKSEQFEPVFSLVYKYNAGGSVPDPYYDDYIVEYLKEIGIQVRVFRQNWITFTNTIIVSHDFDLALVGLSGGGASPDCTGVYNENGSLNMFGINTSMPYGRENEDMIQEGKLILNFKKRQQHYNDWQQLLMDKILPMIPLYSQKSYTANWENLDGYDTTWGVVDSLPYMEYDGVHDGQSTTDEFTDSDAQWRNLNPLMQDDSSSSYISNLIMEPILQMTPSFEPIKTGLIEEWEQDYINPHLFKFSIRDDVYWNPSYNITGRNASSKSLDPTTTSLMTGLKGEYSSGTNQRVTAKDAVFTYLAWANPLTSENSETFSWLKRIWVDSADELSFWIEIDGNPLTEELEPYADFWSSLAYSCLPEFFLNSSCTNVTQTSSGIDVVGIYEEILNTPQWETYSTSAFGCGKYMLDYFIDGSETILQRSPYWMKIGAIDGTIQHLNMDTIIIRIIPDQTEALAEFEAGKLDIMGMSFFPKIRKEMQANPRFEIQTTISYAQSFIGFNLRRPFIGGEDNHIFLEETGYEEYTKALAVRKAIMYAINREEINEKMWDGEYIISHSPIFPSQTFWYNNRIIKYRYDVDLALKWFEVAGIESEQPTQTQTPTQTTFMIPFDISAVAIIYLFTIFNRAYNRKMQFKKQNH